MDSCPWVFYSSTSYAGGAFTFPVTVTSIDVYLAGDIKNHSEV